MATIIGPSRYLPGDDYPCEKGYCCDQCAEAGIAQTATKAIVQETDSLGSEVGHFCEAHYLSIKQAVATESIGDYPCERCGSHHSVRKCRDPEEGSTGKLYDWCAVCYNRVMTSFIDDLSSDDPDILLDDDIN